MKVRTMQESLLRLEDFIDAPAFLVVNCAVRKCPFVIAVGFLSLFFSAAAQEMLDAPSTLSLYRPDVFSTVDSSALIHQLPVFALLDGQRLPVSTDLGRMGIAPLNLFPAAYLASAATQKTKTTRTSAPTDAKDSPVETVNSPLDPVYATGEVGVLYGRWSGKSGGDLWESYMVGDVGNDKFHITVGAAYEESSGHFPRFRTFAPPR
jgi:hypothetical protein